jgi:hypothetical protein
MVESMSKGTLSSSIILFVSICLLAGFSIGLPEIWTSHLSHWTILFFIALILTFLMGLVLMDDLFELDSAQVLTLGRLSLKIEIKRYFVWAFCIIGMVAIILETIQFFLSQGNVSLLDPLIIIAGSALGIIVHIIGSSLLMKRVEFELERWEDNVL